MSFITSPGVIVPPLTAGGVAYGTGGQAKVNLAGTAGQVLTSAGAGVPIWAAAVGPATPSAEGILYGKTNNLTPFQTFLGYQAGNVTTGVNNTWVGYQSGLLTTSGTDNTAVGFKALDANTTGIDNVSVGSNALGANTTGFQNTANGTLALTANTTGYQNTATGYQALRTNTTGYQNTASSFQAMYGNTTGFNNTAVGHNSLYFNTTGNSNTVIGTSAGSSGINDLTTGSNNILIGYNSEASSATVSNENTFGNSSSTSNRFWGDMKMGGSAAGTTGQVLTSAGAGVAPTWAAAGGITLGTPVATTAGTQFNYTGIPSGKKQIEIMFAGVQLLSADDIIVQLGNSGGIQSTNYFGSYRNSGAGNSVGYTSGFLVASSLSAAYVWNGALVIWLQNSSSNIWAGHSVLGASNTTQTGNAAGVKTVSGVVDRIRITTTAGTTVFVAGEINISYS